MNITRTVEMSLLSKTRLSAAIDLAVSLKPSRFGGKTHAALLISAALLMPQAGYAQELLWDGGNTALHDNGAVDAGTGTWDASNRNWTTGTGATNGSWTGNSIAVFSKDSTVNIVGEQVVNGLRFSGATTLSSDAGGSLRLGQDMTFIDAFRPSEISANITGNGSLIVNGALTLTGKNSYTGGTLIGSSSYLTGNADSIRGRVSGWSVVFEQNEDAVYADTISTTFATKTGAGTLRLLQASSASWFINSGTLIPKQLDAAPEVRLGGTLRYEGSGGQFGNIYGDGNVEIAAGTGGMFEVQLFNRNAPGKATFSGLMSVESGTLAGSIYSNGSIIVKPGASFTANVERSQRLENFGTVSPSRSSSLPDSVGHITLTGDYVHHAGAVLKVNITPTENDSIQAGTTATLLGGEVRVEKVQGQYARTARYTLITANQGVTGTFATLTQNLPFLNLRLAYDAQHVYLDIARSRTRFADACLTFNQCQIAHSIDSVSDSETVADDLKLVVDELTTQSAAQAMASIDTLSGEVHASLAGALLNNLGTSTTTVADHLSRISPAGTSDVSNGLWIQAHDLDSKLDSDGNAGSITFRSKDLSLGADRWLSGHWLLGAALNAGRSDLHLKNADKAKTDTKGLSVYSSLQGERAYLRAVLDYTKASNKVERRVAVGPIRRQANADYDSTRTGLYLEGGLSFDVGSSQLQPLISVEHGRLKSDAFREFGAQEVSLIGRSQKLDRTTVGAGVRWIGNISRGGWTFSPAAELRWLHDTGDVTPFTQVAFAGAPTIWSEVDGVAAPSDRGVAGLSFTASRGNRLDLTLDYDYQHAGRLEAHNLSAGLRYKW